VLFRSQEPNETWASAGKVAHRLHFRMIIKHKSKIRFHLFLL